MKNTQIALSGLIFLSLSITQSFAAKETTKDMKSGTIKIDGSSTVFPISEAMAEEFQKANKGIRVTVGVSGTGGGFKKFTVGEIDIADASRPITALERAAAKKNKVEYIELPIAYDGIAVVVNPKNTFVDFLSIEELKRIWQPQSTVKMWSDVRPMWPKEKISLFGPGTDSGTFDYFTEEVVGKAKSSRSDFSPSEDDNVLVQGISGDAHSLGYFGFAYFEENQDKLKLVPIKAGDGKAVLPSAKTIESNEYLPLARPIFIYVNKASAENRPEIRTFIQFYLKNCTKFVPQVGYVPLRADIYGSVLNRFETKMTGTTFGVLTPEKRSNIAEIIKSKGQE